jgi:predicted nucleic acid-binding protein
MNIPVIDACVAIKWFLPEQGYEKASGIIQSYPEFLAPELFLIEIDAVITKKVRKREIELSEAYILYDEVRKLPFKLIRYDQTAKLSFELSATLPITTYNATYLSVALQFNEEVYTADRRFYRGVSTTPFRDYVKSIDDF